MNYGEHYARGLMQQAQPNYAQQYQALRSMLPPWMELDAICHCRAEFCKQFWTDEHFPFCSWDCKDWDIITKGKFE